MDLRSLPLHTTVEVILAKAWAGGPSVEVDSALACSKRVEAAAAACHLDSDRVKTLPAAPIAAKAWEMEGLAQSGFGPTLWAHGGGGRGNSSTQPRAAATDPADPAQAQSESLDRGSTPAGPVALEAQEAL